MKLALGRLIALIALSAPTAAFAEPTELAACMDKVDLGALKEQQ